MYAYQTENYNPSHVSISNIMTTNILVCEVFYVTLIQYTNHIWLEGFIEIIARVFPLTPDCKEGVNEDECNNFDKARHHKCD